LETQRGRIDGKDHTLIIVASVRRHAVENIAGDHETAVRLVASILCEAEELLVASAILVDRKDEAGVVCSTLQRGAVQLIVKRGHRVMTGIIVVSIAVISVVTGEDVID
jgi:hypothetical protein